MKKVKILTVLLAAAGVLFLVSCNSGDDKKVDETKTDTTATPTTEVSILSGPTSVMIVRVKIADYDKWLPGYESDDSARLASGLHNYVIARGTEDPNHIMVACIMDDLAKAKAFASSPWLKEKMKKGGVSGAPVIDFLHSVLNDTTAIQATERVMIRHKVKDWDAWKKSFDSHKQARIEAGLIDRVISYTDGDNHNVTLVFAVNDLEKAKAFMNSDDLKNKMKEAGVEGAPDFFYYKIVRRY